jgi:hypothetical protein
MATTKKRFVFHAEPELTERIERVSSETGAPVAEVIRRALRNNLFMDSMTPDQRRIATGHQPVLFTPKQETR